MIDKEYLKFQSTHPSWGATLTLALFGWLYNKFQSTHPSWGATFWNSRIWQIYINFNPRTHRGVRRQSFRGRGCICQISIHAPIVGCDLKNTGTQAFLTEFQSTHPSWGATTILSRTRLYMPNFNPRTHRGVRLYVQPKSQPCRTYFNPRTHRGVRQAVKLCLECVRVFQSTHPSWGATVSVDDDDNILAFQSTHPSWGATAKIAKFLLEFHYFWQIHITIFTELW